MKNKINSCIFLMLALFALQQSFSQKCPANFDGKSYGKIKNEMPKHRGETVAFDGEVSEIRKGYNDIPYFSIKFDNGELLWISSMVSDKYVVKGMKLRLLGYIEPVLGDDEIALQFNQSGYHVRAFAMLDHKTKQMQMANVFEKEVNEWLDGKIPPDLRY